MVRAHRTLGESPDSWRSSTRDGVAPSVRTPRKERPVHLHGPALRHGLRCPLRKGYGRRLRLPRHLPQRNPLVPRQAPRDTDARSRATDRYRQPVHADRRHKCPSSRSRARRDFRSREPGQHDQLRDDRGRLVDDEHSEGLGLHPLVRSGSRPDVVPAALRATDVAGMAGFGSPKIQHGRGLSGRIGSAADGRGMGAP